MSGRNSDPVDVSPLSAQSDAPAGDQRDEEPAVIVVSNRQPYRHEWDGDEVTVSRPTGGLSSGLDAALREVGGTWIAWGDGDADKVVVDDDCVTVPPDAPEDEQYTLNRVWLDEDEVDNYYYGFSNRVLWPLCHNALTTVRSNVQYWETYRDVNEHFADAIATRASADDVVWLQDYHLALAPQMLGSRLSEDVSVTQFWHIPWPSWDTFRACPHAEELLRGLLGNDLFCVHVPRYRKHFLECVDAALPEAVIDWSTGQVFHRDGTTTVEVFPLGVDLDRIDRHASTAEGREGLESFVADHDIDDDTELLLSVDRLDYSKGILTRLFALEHFLETNPEWRGELTFVQVGTESRSSIPAYSELQTDIGEAVARINERFATADWKPIVYTTDYVANETLYALFRSADICLVTPLRDGMNLVAQEFVAAQTDADPGVLVLSTMAGVHDLVGDAAVSVAPYDTTQFVSGIEEALSMSVDERRERFRELHGEIQHYEVSVWVNEVLDRITSLATSDREQNRV
ncbi:trehalose-6-phosphate synthase [Haloferax namakaokahaiae]|uniref:Trehalose-6-phosphate synthase n=1 Tax=Haloferax namakaokahaiae TaxID=1748331 RepID=A0ABD5ZD55_9EURY